MIISIIDGLESCRNECQQISSSVYPLFFVFEICGIKYYIGHNSFFFIFGKVSYIRFIDGRKGISLICGIFENKKQSI